VVDELSDSEAVVEAYIVELLARIEFDEMVSSLTIDTIDHYIKELICQC